MLSRCEPEKSVRKHEALVFDQGAVVVKGPLKRIASPLWAVTCGIEADSQREKLCRQSDLPTGLPTACNRAKLPTWAVQAISL